MNARPLLAGTLILLSSCTTSELRLPVSTRLNPLWQGIRPQKSGTFAFIPEPDMRQQKSLFYERIKGDLTEEGFMFGDLEKADFLIQVIVMPRTRPMGIDPNSGYFVGAQVSSGDANINEFHFFVYLGHDKDSLAAASNRELAGMVARSIWRADVYATPEVFREHEKQLIQQIFGHLGEDFHNTVVLPLTANQSPGPTPGAVR